MTSRRDSYAEEVAEWADVSLSQRIAAGFSDILNTATAIEEMLIDAAELTHAAVAVARIHEHATAALLHLAPCRLPASARP